MHTNRLTADTTDQWLPLIAIIELNVLSTEQSLEDHPSIPASIHITFWSSTINFFLPSVHCAKTKVTLFQTLLNTCEHQFIFMFHWTHLCLSNRNNVSLYWTFKFESDYQQQRFLSHNYWRPKFLLYVTFHSFSYNFYRDKPQNPSARLKTICLPISNAVAKFEICLRSHKFGQIL